MGGHHGWANSLRTCMQIRPRKWSWTKSKYDIGYSGLECNFRLKWRPNTLKILNKFLIHRTCHEENTTWQPCDLCNIFLIFRQRAHTLQLFKECNYRINSPINWLMTSLLKVSASQGTKFSRVTGKQVKACSPPNKQTYQLDQELSTH